jgi:hypothetical protein
MTVLLFDLITSFLKASALSKSSWYWARNWSILLFRRGLEVERGAGGIVIVGLVEGFLERVEREYMVEVRVQDEESLLRRDGAFYTGTMLLTRFGNNSRFYKISTFLDAEVTEDSQY